MRPSSAVRLRPVAFAFLLAAAGCNYSFTAGSGFPDYVQTIAVVPFDNETNRFELTQEVHQELLQRLPRALGIQPAGEDVADAVVRGTIRTYDLTAPLYQQSGTGNAAEVLQREVVLAVQVEIIDLTRNEILWDNQSLRVQGQYAEGSGTEEEGRRDAIELLIQQIVDGAQSNW